MPKPAPKHSTVLSFPPRTEVPVSDRQREMILRLDRSVSDAVQQRDTVLNAIVASVEFEGSMSVVGLEPRDGKWVLVLAKTEPPIANG